MEVLIVLFVVGIMISGIIPLFLGVISANKNSEYYSTAYRMADSKVEELRTLTFEQIDGEAGTFQVSELPSGNMTVDVSDVINGASQLYIREVSVTINWNFKSEKTYTTSTLITNGGIGR